MIAQSKLNLKLFNKKGLSELKRRLLFVIFALIVCRLGTIIPIPGIDVSILATLIEQQQGTIIEMLNMFSGGALSHASIFTLGIMPYISASIIMQLLTAIHPALSEMKKDNDIGRYKINQYTRYGALFLAIFQAVGVAMGLPHIPGMQGLVFNPDFKFYFTAITSLVCGTIFLMWLGEQITIRGIGNGVSIIIFTGIVAGLPTAISHTIEQARQGFLNVFILILILLLIFIITFLVVFIERGQYHIIINYTKHQQGRKIYIAQNAHLPLKINMSGVMPAIFASSVLLFPATIASWFGNGMNCTWLKTFACYLHPGQLTYIILYAITIIFFCFFYTALIFNPRETAENLKKSSAFIPGVRPGNKTARYIDKIMIRLTLVGAIYITLICLIPEFMRFIIKVPFYFGGTSLLIVVVVIMDFIAQIQNMMISNQYESVFKKAHLKKT